MTTLEELQEEVVAALHILTRDNLLGICYFLNISGEQRTDVRGKSCISLVTHIMKYLEREEVAELEDDGMSELLLLKDKVADMISGIDNETARTEQDIVTAGRQRGMEELRTVNEHQELGIKQTTTSNAIVNDSLHQLKTTAGPQVSMRLSASAQPQPSPHWRKDFKISGQIGEPGQRGKLTFSSLAHQIENGLNRGYPEIEIVDAVIRAISPGLQLHNYLEGKPHLTLPTLRCILRSHFQEKSATELYK